MPAREELRVWRARQGNKREQYGPSVHPLNRFTEYLLCSKNYSSAGDLVVRKTDKNNCPPGAYSPMRERNKKETFTYHLHENPRDGGAWWAAVYGVAQLDTTEVT